jgi:hypothetical protein
LRRDCLFLFFSFSIRGGRHTKNRHDPPEPNPPTVAIRHREKKGRRVLIRQKLERPEREPTVILLLNANLQAANNSATATATPKRDVYTIPPIQPRVSSFLLTSISLMDFIDYISVCCFVCLFQQLFFYRVFIDDGPLWCHRIIPPAPLDRN